MGKQDETAKTEAANKQVDQLKKTLKEFMMHAQTIIDTRTDEEKRAADAAASESAQAKGAASNELEAAELKKKTADENAETQAQRLKAIMKTISEGSDDHVKLQEL